MLTKIIQPVFFILFLVNVTFAIICYEGVNKKSTRSVQRCSGDFLCIVNFHFQVLNWVGNEPNCCIFRKSSAFQQQTQRKNLLVEVVLKEIPTAQQMPKLFLYYLETATKNKMFKQVSTVATTKTIATCHHLFPWPTCQLFLLPPLLSLPRRRRNLYPFSYLLLLPVLLL